MANGLPEAPVVFTDNERTFTRFEVHCPYCKAIHQHQWNGRDTSFAVPAPCDLRTRYHVVLQLDHNAGGEYALNWEE